MSLSTGTRLGPYEIESALGAGGMGEVYRARDTRLNRTVALKILPEHVSDKPEAKERFEREARTISSLNHPNICHLYDVGFQNGTNYLVMELLEGETLADRLRKGALPHEQVIKIAVQICDGLEQAHRRGVVHRDLKPGNIMLTKSGAKLMDFGLAKSVLPMKPPSSTLTRTLSDPGRPLTAEGTILGTIQYMSPEQVEGKDADARSDVFSLGSVLYEMITGKRAFEGKTTASTIAAILASEPPSVTFLQPMSPPALDRVVKTCIAKDPDDRFQSVHDLNLQLKWLADSQTTSRTTSVASGARSRILFLSISGIVALAIALAAFSYLSRSTVAPSVVRAAITPPPDAYFFSLDIEAGAPAISPDGSLLAAAVHDKNGVVSVWVRRIGEAQGRTLPGTEGGGHPFWSPDSHSIGFFADGKLKRIDADDASLQTICDVGLSPRGGSWNRDGIIIFTPHINEPLYQVSANGGTPVPLTTLDTNHGETSHRWPQFLPDGKHYLFLNRSLERERMGIYAGSLDSKPPKMLVNTGFGPAYAAGGYLLFVKNQSLFAQPFSAGTAQLRGEPLALPDQVAVVGSTSEGIFSASQSGALVYYSIDVAHGGYDVTWRDRTGKSLSTLAHGFFSRPAISPDSTKVAIGRYDEHWWLPDLWVFDLLRGSETQFTFGSGTGTYAAWEPDGQGLIYGSATNTVPHIYRKRLNGNGEAEVLLKTDGVVELPRSVCRDGRYLMYTRALVGTKAKQELWALPLFGERKPFPVVQGQFNIIDGGFSPDCKWVAYSTSGPGEPEVSIASFPEGTQRYQVSSGGGGNPRWRQDGKELFFVSPHNGDLLSVAVDSTGQQIRLGSPHVLFTTHGVANRLGVFDVQPDGQRFLVNTEPAQIYNVPLTLVLHWDAALKKQK